MPERARILLVDDEPSVVRMIQKRLDNAGYEVLVAMDGEEGFRKAKEDKPDLIILDLMLPKLNGYEICLMLKKDSRYKKIPIVMFSAKAQPKDVEQGLECGADAYVRKPFRAEELLNQIRALIQPPLSAKRSKA